MNNKSISDYVAASMDAVLKSQEHKSLFGTTYKFASDQNDASSCSAEDDSSVNSADDEDSSVNSANDSSDDSCDSSVNSADDEDVSAAYDVAIDSLITASAALDSLGMEKSATVSLKLASIIVEAKKVDKKKDKKSSDSKKSTDTNSAKDKKNDKKSDKKSDTGSKDKKVSKPSSSSSSKSTSSSTAKKSTPVAKKK